MGRTPRKIAAAATLAALFIGSTATASFAAGVPTAHPTPVNGTPGHYIVVMKDDPVASYEGGEAGLPATKPNKGQQLNMDAPNSQKYAQHLEQKQKKLANVEGITPTVSYQVTVNGFSADLTGAQVDALRASKDVLGVFPDEILHPTAQSSTSYIGLGDDATGAGGVWDDLGGVKDAGAGVVVGVIDTGIAPENPSFAGDKLKKKTKSGGPWSDGKFVYFDKSDGSQFKSPIVTGQGWDHKKAYSTKLIGAQYFSEGAAAAGFDFQYDYLSPRDGGGHGSHTASTAAGNFGVPASVEGTDFGTISGVAPAAKVSSYKVCYEGPDPLDNQDDICAMSDILSAIDAAVTDGVDVINYSIGGGAATTVLGPEDIAYLNAAAAGVFVSVSAGNSGPSASTADHGSPWYTSVGASTIPTWEGTVSFEGFLEAGASVSVPFGETVTGPSILATDAAAADATNPRLCLPGTLDPAKVAGHIVVCERGENARVEKSLVVEQAGGMGMVLVNVPGEADSLDNDFHSVPTVHLSSAHYDAVVGYVSSGTDLPISLIGENTTGDVTPTPQMAGFSSRGPILADGSDVLKPDVTAPGVAILAATNNAPKKAPTFGIMSGTSMSSPHVAGLAALYLDHSPNASPAEIKSALMTTAYDTLKADGSVDGDPFAQGAGHVDPTKYLDPGLLYLNGPADWLSFIEGKGLAEFDGVDPIDGSDLNLASIAIGSLSSTQTVTRTVTSTGAGTYTASVDVPGVSAVVEPSTLTFGAAGETATYTVTFTNETAPVEAWAKGNLTWTSEAHSVRSPIVIYPVTADAPAELTATTTEGTSTVEITPGVSGDLALNAKGLVAMDLLVDDANPVEGHSGNENSGDAEGNISWVVDVPEGTALSRFSLDSSDDTGSDLDLFVYRVVSPEDLRYYEVFQSASASADEQVTLSNPTAGTYLVVANMYSTTAPMTWDMFAANVPDAGEPTFTVDPNPLPVTQGQPASYDVSWSGLDAGNRYLGLVQYGDSAVQTVVTVNTAP